MAVTHQVTLDRGDDGRRLDLVVRRHMTRPMAATRTRIQRWIAGGQVTVNGAVVRRPAARTRAGDQVSVRIDDPARRLPRPEAGLLSVLYEDEHFLAVDKAPGMVVHPGYHHRTGTVLNLLLWRARDWPSPQRPSIVGRLDKLTSGVVIVAKTAAAHAGLQRALTVPAARKDYLAIVHGRMKAARARIDFRLERDATDRRRVVASAAAGLVSMTTVERLGRTRTSGPALSLVRCRLHTGRMHQIRAHLLAYGRPIVGDPVYGRPGWMAVADPALSTMLRTFPRQALHASSVEFTHPMTGTRVRIEAPMPGDMQALAAAAGLGVPRAYARPFSLA